MYCGRSSQLAETNIAVHNPTSRLSVRPYSHAGTRNRLSTPLSTSLNSPKPCDVPAVVAPTPADPLLSDTSQGCWMILRRTRLPDFELTSAVRVTGRPDVVEKPSEKTGGNTNAWRGVRPLSWLGFPKCFGWTSREEKLPRKQGQRHRREHTGASLRVDYYLQHDDRKSRLAYRRKNRAGEAQTQFCIMVQPG